MELAALRGLSVVRWTAFAWVTAVAVVSFHEFRRPWLAVILLGAAFAVTVSNSRPSSRSVAQRWAVIEVAVGLCLVVGDGFVYGSGHVFSTSQSLGSVWPLVGVLALAITVNGPVAAAAGLAMGVGRLLAVIGNGVESLDAPKVLSLLNTAVFYVVAGASAGYFLRLLRRAENEVAIARAREELGRKLHDGVLQTLAVVERRTGDPELAALARSQELELRAYLFGQGPAGPSRPLAESLRDAAARFEANFGGRAEVVVAPDLDPVGPEIAEALAGAVTEALTNSGKHGHASRATVYVEPADDSGVFCSVKDDGAGFDPTAVREGIGLSRSIRGRIEELGGRAEVVSQPGAGTEVRLWIP